MLAVATPVLAGRVVDAIVDGAATATVVWLAVAHRVLAVAEAGLGLLNRWLSASIGEGLILDLRTAVFDHVQRMPVAFFTRTRTGALVSRLNNDVIGAQRAFSDTLSGVVSNLVTLLLTLGGDARASPGRSPLLALVLLPVFVAPARRMGARLARLAAGGGRPQRRDEHPDDRALLRARRHAGQAVRPARREESAEFARPGRPGARHRRAHRDGAVRSSSPR